MGILNPELLFGFYAVFMSLGIGFGLHVGWHMALNKVKKQHKESKTKEPVVIKSTPI